MKAFLIADIFLLWSNFLIAQQTNEIKLNQSGYYPLAPKIALLTGNKPATVFYITSTDLKDTFYISKLSGIKQSTNSSIQTRIADFSIFQRKGNYVISIPGVGYSYPIRVADHANHSLAVASLKGYYFQRVSIPLLAEYAGKWARPAGHPDTAVLIHPSAASKQRPAGTIIAAPGGWFDAGDYNKYIVNSGITMGTLLSAYEDYPSYFDTLYTHVPESKNGLPDILNEILYNLRWMLTMQDPNDGGVYHKCTNAAFDKMVMPGVTKLPRYAVQKGTAAALDFAAVLAQASRILQGFKNKLPGLSDSCLNAAVRAWQWAEKNPLVAYDQDAINKLYEPKITTGAYGDRHFNDELFWAASEMFIATKEKKYSEAISKEIKTPASLPSWSNVYLLGCYSLVRNEKRLPLYFKDDILIIKSKIIAFADSLINNFSSSAFQTVMGQSRNNFIWGSNSVAANQGVVLINAYLITKNKKYIEYALTNLDYILGRNATGYCFVTGIGTKSSMHPHHRPSVADGNAEPVPGLMVGGPNPGMQDHCHYDFTEPETAYSDIDCAYASNEIAINWNAPLVYLANAIESLQESAGFSK